MRTHVHVHVMLRSNVNCRCKRVRACERECLCKSQRNHGSANEAEAARLGANKASHKWSAPPSCPVACSAACKCSQAVTAPAGHCDDRLGRRSRRNRSCRPRAHCHSAKPLRSRSPRPWACPCGQTAARNLCQAATINNGHVPCTRAKSRRWIDPTTASPGTARLQGSGAADGICAQLRAV